MKRWTLHVLAYSLFFGLANAWLELYNVFLFQKHRAYLPFSSPSLVTTICVLLLASVALGAVVGGLFGALDYSLQRLRHKAIVVAWFLCKTLVFVLVLAFHWVNAIFFDVTQIYLTRPPLNVFSLLQYNVRVIYDRTLRNSLDILFQYYSSVHLFLLVFFLIFSLYLRKFVLAMPEQVEEGSASVQARRVWVVLGLCMLLGGALPFALPKVQRQALCFGTTFTMWTHIGCRYDLPKATQPPRNPRTQALLDGFAAFLRSQGGGKSIPTRTPTRVVPVPRRAPALAPTSQPGSRPSSRPVANKSQKKTPLKPNILLLLMESVAARHVGAYGYRKRNTTPVFDRLAKGCMRYKWAFANSNISAYGISAVFGSRVGENVKSKTKAPIFPIELKKAGYQIGLFVPGYQYERIDLYMQGAKWNRFFDMYASKSYRLRIRPPCHLDCHSVKEFHRWWRKRESTGPLFASMTLYSTHFPYETPPVWRASYTKKKLQFYSPVYFHREELPTVIAHYDNSIRFVDAMQEHVLRIVRKSKRPTYIIITSDHGEDLYQHGDASHGTNLFHSQIRVPLVVCGPGIKPGVREDNASLIDIGPTVLKMAGMPRNPQFEGRDLLAPPPKKPRPVFLYNNFIRQEKAVISGPYKLIRSSSRKTEELYHFHKDPQERKNILHDQPDVAKALRWMIAEYWAKKKRK